MASIDALVRPGKIGKILLKNRLVMSAMGGISPSRDGGSGVNQKAINFYTERAKGGVGLIIVPSVVSNEINMPGSAAENNDKSILRMRELVQTVQSYGTKMVCQLGFVTLVSWPGVQQVGPSSVPCFTHKITPRAISVEEIHRIVDSWGEAAYRAKEAGMDGVEIQAAHGYFLSAFHSPFLNRRTDKYGGSVENRARFSREVITRVREIVGADFPILIRMNGSDFIEGGLTVHEAKLLAMMFTQAGVDAIDVSATIQDSRQWRDLSYLFPNGAIVHLAETIKKAVSVPVIAVGKINDPAFASRIIEEGKADFVAMGRALLAEPGLLNKTLAGHQDEIHGCIYCNNCRIDRTSQNGTAKKGLACTVNAALGREKEFEIKPAAKHKRVMVVGGGLAGLESARVLAERGHDVFLYEKSSLLGGQWNIACKLPDKTDFQTLLPYLVKALNKTTAKINLNREVTPLTVREDQPDAIVLATGALPLGLDVPGAKNKNVLQAVDIIAGKETAGDKVVVIGGRLRGMETAELLVQQGKKVTLVTRNRLGGSGEPLERNLFVTLRNYLVEKGVMLFPFAPVFEIKSNGVYVVIANELLFLQADTIVLAVGAKPENTLVNALQGTAPEIYAVGDCARVRDAREAINEGSEIGRLI
jgi:2,4-dienoyl-CoA reductase-like NADH-dependent reductase (Old Yellow Enzyme family)/thioredoxin reductase